MRIKFAVLSILAERPDGCATLAELDREVTAMEHDRVNHFSDVDDIDVLQLGLAVLEDDHLRITDAGRSVLRGFIDLGSRREVALRRANIPHSLKMIDDLIGTEQRLKVFDLGLRASDGTFVELEDEPIIKTLPPAPAEIDPFEESVQSIVADDRAEIDDFSHQEEDDAPAAPAPTSPAAQPPAFLNRGFGGQEDRTAHIERRKRDRLTVVVKSLGRFLRIWRGHIQRETIAAPGAQHKQRATGVGGVAAALITLLVLVICAGTLIAISQIKSLKTEIAALERELVPLKKQAAKPAAAERKAEASRKVDTQEDLDARFPDKSRLPAHGTFAPSALILSSDEIRLIRDYIKPAPSGSAGAIPINVGDPVAGGTIPLPSPITDKIPKLQGARFTIRSGSIIIIKRDSQKADAVLPPL